MDLNGTLAINLPAVENIDVGAVEPEDTTQWLLVFEVVIFSDNSFVIMWLFSACGNKII